MGIKKSAELSDKTNSWKKCKCIQIIIHVWLFFKRVLLHNPSAPNIMIGPARASGVIMNSSILRQCIALTL